MYHPVLDGLVAHQVFISSPPVRQRTHILDLIVATIYLRHHTAILGDLHWSRGLRNGLGYIVVKLCYSGMKRSP